MYEDIYVVCHVHVVSEKIYVGFCIGVNYMMMVKAFWPIYLSIFSRGRTFFINNVCTIFGQRHVLMFTNPRIGIRLVIFVYQVSVVVYSGTPTAMMSPSCSATNSALCLQFGFR